MSALPDRLMGIHLGAVGYFPGLARITLALLEEKGIIDSQLHKELLESSPTAVRKLLDLAKEAPGMDDEEIKYLEVITERGLQ